MKQLLVASGYIAMEDDVADAVLDYERALGELHRTERVRIPAFINEGDTVCELILGCGTVWGTITLPNTDGRRVAGSKDAVRNLRERAEGLRAELSLPFDDDWYRDVPPEVG